MHESMARPLSRDADGKPLMTLEELKEGMFQSIRDNGTVELIRAQLRRRFIEKFQQQRQNQENDAERAPCHVSTPDEKLVNGLVLEYLTNKGLENTLAVFLPEIGGSQNQLDRGTVLQNNEQEWSDQSLLFVLVQERRRRVKLATTDSQTQTAMDCFDHRLVLEKELRRLESCYLATCAAQKDVPQKSIEERMIDYEREYNDICNQRLHDEIERFQSTEIALVRAEERKRYSRELDSLRTTLLQESRAKQEHLQERERDCELAFVARKTELETSLFGTRQSLFQDREKLRVKEAELQVKTEQEFRRVAMETQRLQTWEESVRTQEENVQSLIAQRLREKERIHSRERQEMVSDLEKKEETLMQCKQALATLTDQVNVLEHEVVTLKSSLMKCNKELQVAQATTLQLNTDQQDLINQVTEAKTQVEDYKLKYVNADMTITRLVAEAHATADVICQCKAKSGKRKEQLLSARNEVQSFQQQVYDLKLCEGNALMGERKKLMQVIHAERQEFQWQENEWLTKVREMTTRVAEAEALASKFQNQFEDEKVQVETLRQDVASLNALLTQAQATIMAKHGHGPEWPRSRGRRSLLGSMQQENKLIDRMDEIMATLHRRDDVAQKWHATGTQVALNWQVQQKSEWQTTRRGNDAEASDKDQGPTEWQEDRPRLNETKQEREGYEERARWRCDWIANESVEERQQGTALEKVERQEKSFQGEEREVATLMEVGDEVHERKTWRERREEEKWHVEGVLDGREENEVRMKCSEEREGEEEEEGWRLAKKEKEEKEGEEHMWSKEVQTALQHEDDGRREEVRRWVEEERREAERVERIGAVENIRLAICIQDDGGDVKDGGVEASIGIETVEDQAPDTVDDGICGTENVVTENVVDKNSREINHVESTSLSILSCFEEENPDIVEERTKIEDEKLAVNVGEEDTKGEDKELTINDNEEENKKEDEKVAIDVIEEATKKENEKLTLNENEEENNNEDEKVAINVNEEEIKNGDKEVTINDNEEENKKDDEKVANNVRKKGTKSEDEKVTIDVNEEETKNEDEKVAINEKKEEIKYEDEKAVVNVHEEEVEKEDEYFMDVYRQRVIARKAAEKQHELERVAITAREEPGDQVFHESSESDQDLELSGGSFAESSAASNSDSF